MRTMVRWVALAAGAVVALALVAAAGVYAASEVVVRRTYEPAPLRAPLVVPTDSTAVAEGRRLAAIRGCYEGCHGLALEGRVFFDEPAIARIVAPDLTAAARRYSVEELERIIRHGVLPNGRSVWAMPSDMFHAMSDEDLVRIIAFIRSQPPSEGPGPSFRAGPIGRVGVLAGQFSPTAVLVTHGEDEPPLATPRHEPRVFGRYLARTSCTECHGADLLGHPQGAPSLVVAAAYSLEEFAHLMRTGEALGGRELDLMALVAQKRFSHFTEEEVAALHGYLSTLISEDALP